MNEYKYNPLKMTPFKWFVLENFPFIEEDFDAITSYQLWCKLKEYFDKVATKTNELGSEVENLSNAFIVLKNYVDNYFTNLDVQDEINNKLDEMAEDGTLENLVLEVIKLKSLICFNNIQDLKNSNNLIEGSFVKTLGFYSINDSGGAYYVIKINDGSTNEINKIILNNNLMAELVIENRMNIKQFAAKNDLNFDSTNNIQTALNICEKLIFPQGSYKITNSLTINNIKTLYFENCIISAENVEKAFIILNKITTIGSLELNGNNNSYVGLFLENTRGSKFDSIDVHNFKIWGIYSSPNGNNNFMNFNYIHSSYNGTVISTKGTYSANHSMIVNLTEEQKNIIQKDYNSNLYVVDNSNYHKNYNDNYIPFNRIWAIDTIFISSNSGLINTKSSSRNVVNDDYINKDCYIIIGGGVGLIKTPGGVININTLDSSNSSVAIEQSTAFGGHIGIFASQSDYIPLSCSEYCRNLSISDFYAEGSQTGLYAVSYLHLYCSILQLKLNMSEDSYFNSSQIVNIANGLHDTLVVKNIGQQFLQNKTLYHTSNSAITINELSQNKTVMKRNFQANSIAVNIDLKDIDLLYNYFQPKEIFVETTNLTNPMLFKLSDNLINNGYTIKNSVDNIYTVNQTSNNFIIIISLYNKEFLISKIDI